MMIPEIYSTGLVLTVIWAVFFQPVDFELSRSDQAKATVGYMLFVLLWPVAWIVYGAIWLLGKRGKKK